MCKGYIGILVLDTPVLGYFYYLRIFSQVEGILNGIVSMLALETGDKKEQLTLNLCKKLSKAPNNQMGLVCLKVDSKDSYITINYLLVQYLNF